MIDVQEKKNRIISFLKISGPSLPVRIAKTIEMDPIFASAILSELLGTKQIKTSHMKVGASPLYFIPGQEQKLEDYTENLKPLEKEALLKLKENETLTDEKEDPSIRVALRNIKDFAIPSTSQDKIIWTYAFTTKKKPETNPIKEIPTTTKHISHAKKPTEQQSKIENIFSDDKPKPEFLNEVKSFLQKKEIEFLEEIQSEKKEIVAKVNIKSDLGNINFLLIAKNKRTTSKEEITASIQRAQYNKMPCLLIIRKKPSKSLQKIIDENHLIKLQIMQPQTFKPKLTRLTMGRIKSTLIKRTSRQLIGNSNESFGKTFKENKKALGNILPSKKMRNKIAGYIARINKNTKNIIDDEK